MGGYLIPGPNEGYPIPGPDPDGRYPIPGPDRGYPIPGPDGETFIPGGTQGTPCLDLARVPPTHPVMGVPPGV